MSKKNYKQVGWSTDQKTLDELKALKEELCLPSDSAAIRFLIHEQYKSKIIRQDF